MTPSAEQRLVMRDRPAGFHVMKQRWAGLAFFHWEIDAELIARKLPKGLHVDTFEGRAYIGIVPFFMQRIRPVGLVPLPWLSWFHELNLRTYVHDDEGNPGVWFFCLDCNQPIAVEIARRFFHLPYQHARMSSTEKNGVIRYNSKRRNSDLPESRFTYPQPKAPAPAEFGSLDWFLAERYLLFSETSDGKIAKGRVHHSPYQIEAINEAEYSATLFFLNGFPEPKTPPVSMLSANHVDVTIFPLEKP
ncbi:YqjF family protein [Luteolibacter sp. AS25]|uniref:YqjF family protein n=1 Tax=Luteolibacter sp. AS25 TaxID=3135776 RepID=UPI00398AE58A